MSPLSRPLTTVELIWFWWNNNLEEKTEYTENIPVSVTLSTKNHHQNQSVRQNPHLTQYEVGDCESELYHGPCSCPVYCIRHVVRHVYQQPVPLAALSKA